MSVAGPIPAKGVFAPGTMRSTGLNMYDTASSKFSPLPDGPYEHPQVSNQPTAQRHFVEVREIKLKEPHGPAYTLPETSYRNHYPPKLAPLPDDTLAPINYGVPFDATTTYRTEFYEKDREPRPVPAMSTTKQSETTSKFQPYDLAPTTKLVVTRPAAPPCDVDLYKTTNMAEYPAKPTALPKLTGTAVLRTMPPLMNGETTYTAHYPPKAVAQDALAIVPVADLFPFDASTTYNREFTPKQAEKGMPPLTGVQAREGLQLPIPRMSLGCQYWVSGNPDNYYLLIPRTTPVPCTGRQVFTTVHDNQQQACILVLYGDDPQGSKNMLLGQFDLVNIPPAPKDVPRIEVTFRLDANMFLTAEARDLDTQRHKKWLQRGEVIVLRQ